MVQLGTLSLWQKAYDLDAITAAINIPQVTLSANSATLKVIIKVTAPYRIDFDVPNSLSSVLGFEKRIYEAGTTESANTVNIMSITNFKVVTNIVRGTYDNGSVGNTLYTFFPNVPPGYKIIETPPQPIYLPVSVDRLTDLYVALVDQDEIRLAFAVKS